MERGPLLDLLKTLVGTENELTITLQGENNPVEIVNVVDVEPLHSSHGIKITTKQNYIWLDASHVSAAWQACADL